MSEWSLSSRDDGTDEDTWIRKCTWADNWMRVWNMLEDDWIRCLVCKSRYKYMGECPLCGPPIVVKDPDIPLGVPNRATKTAPSEWVRIGPSTIHGRGVFAVKKIPFRTQFGPYGGTLVRYADRGESSGYDWNIYADGQVTHWLEAGGETHTNWMRFINCSRHPDEQNTDFFQYKKQIFYRALWDIDPGEELLVWYGDAYARSLGLLDAQGRYTFTPPKPTTAKSISRHSQAISRTLTPKSGSVHSGMATPSQSMMFSGGTTSRVASHHSSFASQSADSSRQSPSGILNCTVCGCKIRYHQHCVDCVLLPADVQLTRSLALRKKERKLHKDEMEATLKSIPKQQKDKDSPKKSSHFL